MKPFLRVENSVARLGDLLQLGNFSKPVVTIILPKSSTLLCNFCKGVKIFHFSSKFILGNFYRHLATFYWSHCYCVTCADHASIPFKNSDVCVCSFDNVNYLNKHLRFEIHNQFIEEILFHLKHYSQKQSLLTLLDLLKIA